MELTEGDHVKLYAPVPPVTATRATPDEPPWQRTGEVLGITARTAVEKYNLGKGK